MNCSRWRWALPAAIFFACSPSLAGGLNVYPIRLQVDGPRDLQQLTLTNTNDSRPLVVQIEVFRWTQPGGEEHLTADRDFLATPPLLEIPPQGRRKVRVGPRNFPDQSCETSYRLVLTEIPQKTGPQAPVNFRTRMRLPLFAKSEKNCPPDVHWQRQGQALLAENRGSGHIQYQSLTASQGDQQWKLRLNQVGYVLPGSTVRFELPEDVGPEALELETTTRRGTRRLNLPPRG